jgi:dihydropyrimidinase
MEGAAMFDTVISGAQLVSPSGPVYAGNIGITAGKIAAITSRDIPLEGKHKIDATGKHLFPGVIEPHSHLGIGCGAEELDIEMKAAARGGVTTVLFFLRRPTAYEPLYAEVKALGEEKSVIDFSFHIVLMTDEHLQSIPKYVHELGVTSFKFYLTYRGRDARMADFGGQMKEFTGIDDGFMLDCFKAIAEHPKAIVIVHAEDIEIVNRAKKRLMDAGRDDMEAWALSRPVFAEVEGVRRALSFAQEAGCAINILHLTSKAALKEAVSFKNGNSRMFVEVCHPYLVLNEEVAKTNLYKVRPPLRKPEDNEELWRGVQDGRVYTIGSDHVPRKLAQKMGSVWSPAAGAAGTPFILPVVLTEGHHKRGISLSRIAEVLSLNPAKLYSLPFKGDLKVGYDADLVIVDVNKEYQLSAKSIEQFSDYIIYEGMKVKGYPEMTMVRGRVVAENGVIKSENGWGQFVSR